MQKTPAGRKRLADRKQKSTKDRKRAIVDIPDSMQIAVAAHKAITLKGDAHSTPQAVTCAAQEDRETTLWTLEGFTMTSARRFLDNYLEPFGYMPTASDPNTWTTADKSTSDTGEKLRE